MATTLYLHAAAWAYSGTPPTTQQGTETPTSEFTGAQTLRLMNTTIGTSETFLQLDESEDISHATFVGWWATPPLNAQTLVSSGLNDLKVMLSNSENSLNMNYGGSFQWCAYVWRPSTGTRIAYLGNMEAMTNEIEPSAINTQKAQDLIDTAINDTATCEDGDIVVFELYTYWNPTGSAAYTAKIFYDGTDDTVNTRNTTVTDTASFLRFLHDDWTFQVLTNDLDADATASVTWGGQSTATSNFDQDATASVTWGGRGIYSAAFDSDAAASVTWTGQAINVQAAAFDSDATAALTWNGVSTAAAALDADAIASVTWNGVSTATAALDADAAAALTWNGASSAASVFDQDAAASVTWTGSGDATSAAAFESAATAAVTWNGSGDYKAAITVAAAASLVASGASFASGDWTASPAADLQWNGAEVAPAGEAAWYGTAVADLTAASATIAAAAAEMTATASATFVGVAFGAEAERDLNGWRINRVELARIEEIEEEDILILTAALFNYLENCNGY